MVPVKKWLIVIEDACFLPNHINIYFQYIQRGYICLYQIWLHILDIYFYRQTYRLARPSLTCELHKAIRQNNGLEPTVLYSWSYWWSLSVVGYFRGRLARIQIAFVVNNLSSISKLRPVGTWCSYEQGKVFMMEH